MHAVVTIGEAILGFIVAIIISLVIGILMDFVSIIKMSLSYYVGYTDDTYNNYSTTFMIWFGFGTMPKVLMVMLTCFSYINKFCRWHWEYW